MSRNVLAIATLLLIVCADSVFAQRGGIDYFASHDKATAHYMRIVEDNHLRSNRLDKSIYQLISEGSYNQAFGELKYLLIRIPNHPVGLQVVGNLSQLTKKLAIATSYFETALALYPQHAITHAQYGQFLLEIGQVDNGIEKLKKAIEINPKMPAAYALLANAFSKKGDPEQAREAAEKAREMGFKGKLPAGL